MVSKAQASPVIRFFASLRLRLLLLVLLALLPALGLVIYTAYEQRRLAATGAQENALRLASVAAGTQEEVVEGAHQLLMALAQIPVVRDSDHTACSYFLAEFLKQYPRYSTFGVTDRDGNLVCSAIPADVPINIGDDSFIPKVLETRDFAVGEYRIAPISGNRVVGFGYPLLDASGKPEAVVFTTIHLDSLNQIAAKALLPPGSTLTMRDRNGTILSRYPDWEAWVGRSVPDAPVLNLAAGQSRGTAQAVGLDDVPRLYAFTWLDGVPQKDVYVSVGIPVVVAFAEVNQMLVRNLVTLGLVAVLALAAAWFSADLFILRHVKALLGVTTRLADGDLSARTGFHYGVGELSQLACAFDRMVEKLEQREGERKQADERVRRWSTLLEGLINAVAEAISQPLDACRVVDIALCKTLKAMDLAAGCVFLKRGEGFHLVVQRQLLASGARGVPRSELDDAATTELARWADSNVAEQVSLEALATVRIPRWDEFPSWISIPIRSQGRVLGVMCLASASARSLELQEQSVLSAVGQQVGVAIENAELYTQVQSVAALTERERLSRELHDGLAQVLGYLSTKNKVAIAMIGSGEVERAEAQLQEMQRTIHEAYQDVRESILGLRTMVSPNRGLGTALREYVHKFSLQTGIRVNLVLNGDDHAECAPEAEVQLLRIIQEALSNVRKHSDARQVWIRFESRADSAAVTIEDDGRGFDPALVGQDGQPHYGLQTMQERAEGVGGSLQISSRPGQGTRVMVTLPLNRGE